MKRILIAVLFSVSLISCATAQTTNELTAKQNLVNRQTFFNKLTDSLATTGKSNTQKASILKERKEARRIARLKKISKEGSPQMRALKKDRKKMDAEIKRRARQKSS